MGEGSPPPHTSPGPPLAKRLRPRHWAALDYVAGALITLVIFATIRSSFRQAVPAPIEPHYFPWPLTAPLALLLAAVAGVAVALRRRRPVAMLGVLLVGSLVLTALTGPDAKSLTYFVPVAYVLYLVAATYEERRNAVHVLTAVFVTLLADVALLTLGWGRLSDRGGPISVALCVIIVWTTGYIVRQRRRYAVRLQQEAASQAVTQERLRIARELHDVVAHSMSVIAVQAGYGQYVMDAQPGDARAALGAIQATSREALDEMRRMLGALRHADQGDTDGVGPAARIETASASGAGSGTGVRSATGPAGTSASDGPAAPLFPAPGLADLDRLVSRTAGAGVRVDVTRVGQPHDLPASIDLSAYRIVQEALTNVVKHAQTSSCRVVIGYWDDELTIEVTDDGAGVPAAEMAGAGASPHGTASHNGNARTSLNGSVAYGARVLDRPDTRHDGSPARSAFGRDATGLASCIPGGGHGIIGMRERATLLGGEFSAGPLPGYGFRVSARIPLPLGGR